ncbi:MAG: RimK family alpha-L-glutamate ligase, partial [Pseudomonadales bacterium]|nr:RimK family alpha-L-glutamate ligase [Pseudomonadales bacterium]
MPSTAQTTLHVVNAVLPLHYPAQPLMGLSRLMTWVYQNRNTDGLASDLLQRCQNENDTNALMDLNILLQLKGDLPTALALQKEALSLKQNYAIAADNKKSAIRLLAFMAAGDILTNTPFEFLALGAGIDLQLLYIDQDGGLPDIIPEHDIAIVAVCELDRNQAVLEAIDKLIINWSKPVLNAPQRILKMTRDLNGIALQHKPGINMPPTLRVHRDDLAKILDGSLKVNEIIMGEDYPLIIRPLDSHAGRGLEKIEHNQDLYAYLMRYNSVGNEVFFVSPFIDYSDKNGLFRKYR